MVKIVLTGGKGFLGSRFENYFKGKYKIFTPDIDELDVTNEEKVMDYFNKIKPNYAIHLAAIAVTDICNEKPEFARKLNVDGAINVAKACKKNKTKLIFASSEQIYNGNLEEGPYKESITPIPNTVYGANKLEAEIHLREILDELWILRFAWVFGLPERDCNMVDEILWSTINNIIYNKKIKVMDNEWRGITYVYDLIENLEKVFEIPYGTYNFGAENSMERLDTVKHIFNILGLEVKFNELVETIPNKYGKIRDLRMDYTKIQNYGINFTETSKAIEKCLKENRIIK